MNEGFSVGGGVEPTRWMERADWRRFRGFRVLHALSTIMKAGNAVEGPVSPAPKRGSETFRSIMPFPGLNITFPHLKLLWGV